MRASNMPDVEKGRLEDLRALTVESDRLGPKILS
jgi:hypothetical protein